MDRFIYTSAVDLMAKSYPTKIKIHSAKKLVYISFICFDRCIYLSLCNARWAVQEVPMTEAWSHCLENYEQYLEYHYSLNFLSLKVSLKKYLWNKQRRTRRHFGIIFDFFLHFVRLNAMKDDFAVCVHVFADDGGGWENKNSDTQRERGKCI